MVDYGDARRACKVEGKRLCTSDEWQFACEGPQMWPYPYGLKDSRFDLVEAVAAAPSGDHMPVVSSSVAIGGRT